MPNPATGPARHGAPDAEKDAGKLPADAGAPDALPPEVTLVRRSADVAVALDDVAGDVVGVDVERADSERYHRHAALVQVGIAGRCVLLDGVELDDLTALDDFLADRTSVFHALENDLEPLAAKNVRPERVADTAVAAALLGMPTGLGTLLDGVLGVQLGGDKARLQRADWEARPLTDDMIEYAAGDVVHLPELWRALRLRLEQAGRIRWYEEELHRIIARAAEQSRSWQRVKGAGSLSAAQRAVLRAVWEARERLAMANDIAPNRLLHDEVIREIAVDPPTSVQELVRRSPRRRTVLRGFADELLAAVEHGLRGDAEPKAAGSRPEPADRAVFDALRTARARVAKDVGIDAGVLCPAQPLWAAVTGEPSDGVQLCRLAGLDGWRTELLAAPLWDAYVTARDEASG